MRYDSEGHELQRLFANWPKLSERAKSLILVLAEVRAAPGPGPRRKIKRPEKGETPEWLLVALNILKDSQGQLSDREIAERLDVSHQTVNAIETEKYDPSLKLAFAIAALFGMQIEDIFAPE